MLSLRVARSAVLALLALAAAAPAQQFQERAGLLPGPVVWTESVIAFDANEDGRLDVLFGNANGWTVPGDLQASSPSPLLPTLLLNNGLSAGQPVFADATAALLPDVPPMHAKSVAAVDVTGDGHEDLLFAAAFNAQPRLLVKDTGSGTFLDETTARLPALLLNSFSVGWGDLDDDGDIDVVFADAGPSSFGLPGGKARLLINDGSGYFTEQAAWLGAINKIGAQNAKLVDLDSDYDLDLIIDGKSGVNHFYRNDGTAHFTLMPGVIPNGNALTYETDWADFDGDSDFDGVYISIGPGALTDGTAQNLLVDGFGLAFNASSSTLAAANGHDDNDIAFIDANDDGRLDVCIATLGNIEERLYLNNGGAFAPGFLTGGTGGFSFVKDSTLDIAFGDFDADGDLDAITGQGETGSFLHRYYENTGPADTRPPGILGVQNTDNIGGGGSTGSGGLATVSASVLAAGAYRHALLQDGLFDDGENLVTASLRVITDKDGAHTDTLVPMAPSGGQLFRGALAPAPSPTGLVGMDVSYGVQASDPNGNTSSFLLPPGFRVCGAESYGTPSVVNAMTLAAGGDPVAGAPFALTIGGGAPNQPAVLLIGFARASMPKFGGTLLVALDGSVPVVPIVLDAGGGALLAAPLPSGAALHGLRVMLQAAALDPAQPAGKSLSTGLELAICAP